MSIPSTTLCVRECSEIFYELYHSTLKNLPAPTITSGDGQYKYELRKLELERKLSKKDAKYLKEKYQMEFKTEAERFAYANRLLLFSGELRWNPDEPVRKECFITCIGDWIWLYQTEFFLFNMLSTFNATVTFKMRIAILVKNNIFSGIDVKSINDWLNEDFISVEDAKILVENTKKFFSQYLA